jgi:hypothetical protein
MVGDPPIRDATDSTQLDSTMFRGKAMTYYGRWTYKYEKASEMGAAAASSSTRPGRLVTPGKS